MSKKPKDDGSDEEPPDPDALDDEMAEDPELDLDEDALADNDGDDDEDDDDEIPAGARPSSDDEEDEDEDDDEVEADLDTILKERLSSAEDEDEEEEEDEGVITTAEGDRIPSKQEDEILCEGCFLLVKESQYDTRDNVPSCPHCGTQLNV
ncbi:MAG: hypothetical protein VX285_07160 [Actinomycetota bacterium]|uniref:Uncharacterized protein n=1 Tax=marine metagenome TaxID=408172 RepID=A0A381R1B4_9ZZZZ|nr:hypothetical protein [Actinomycetota bacterium]